MDALDSIDSGNPSGAGSLLVVTSDHGYRGQTAQNRLKEYRIPLWFYASRFSARRTGAALGAKLFHNRKTNLVPDIAVVLLDVVMEGVDKPGKDEDPFDANVAILTGELSVLIPDLIEALGGELGTEAPEAPGAEPLKLAA